MDYDCPYEDDQNLPLTTVFYRLIPAHPNYARWDGSTCKPTSNAFGEIGRDKALELGYPEPATSILFHDQVMEANLTIEEAADMELNERCGIAKMTVHGVREKAPGVGILFDGDTNGLVKPWHGILFARDRLSLSNGSKKRLRNSIVELIREPTLPPH